MDSQTRHGTAVAVECLLDLLGDDSPRVVAEVRAALVAQGKRAHPPLRRASRSDDPRLRARARQLLADMTRARALRRLYSYAARGQHDLETALWLLARFGLPGIDLAPYRKTLDLYGAEVARRISGMPRGRERALVLVEYLAGELGFTGAVDDYHHPDHVHITRVIERRIGIPLTLCALYHFVGRRAGLETGLLPLPGHVLLSLVEGKERTIVDPFSGGKRVSEEDCHAYLARYGIPYRPTWMLAAAPSAVFTRQVANLRKSYAERGFGREARQLQSTLDLLGPGVTRP